MRVTRIAYSKNLNAGKYVELEEQARRLGKVRTLVWERFGSIAGVGVTDRTVRNMWMADGTADSFGVLANAWKETVRDAVADIRSNREAAKVLVRRKVSRNVMGGAERKQLYTALKYDKWTDEPLLRRWMRGAVNRGHNHTYNQIIIRSDNVRTFVKDKDVWLKIPGMAPRTFVAVPLNTSVHPTGTLRVILRGGKVEVHYTVDDQSLKSSHRPHGASTVGVDKGYTEVLTDSDGNRYGVELGTVLRHNSDKIKERNARRAKLRSIANNAERNGNHAKAKRIRDNNLGSAKRVRQDRAHKIRVRDIVYRAVHSLVNSAATVVAEDLSRPIKGKNRGPDNNRRMSAWTKGVIAHALKDVSERRGSSLLIVNAAYTSQVIPGTSTLGRRSGDRLYCPHKGGVVWDADHAAAVNILDRYGDPDISLYTPYTRVRQILRERDDRQRLRLPSQDSSSDTCRCGELTIQTTISNDQ